MASDITDMASANTVDATERLMGRRLAPSAHDLRAWRGPWHRGSGGGALCGTICRVEWVTLVGTGLGAVLGVGATLAGEQLRWRRSVRDNRLQDRRDMYVDCLVALRRAHEAMRLAADEDHVDPQTRAARIRQAFQTSGCDEARERLILMADSEVSDAIDASYRSLRRVREALASGCTVASEEYQAARQAHGDATRAARTVLRQDLTALEN
ncbi:hypothetical protein ACIPX0_19715 [Streptomyces sp. NPDC090075]|uniref:hypothetical protein n=1 Tax=unclassified Streptomyces TaxID=2593676 RepID=UPI0038153B1C